MTKLAIELETITYIQSEYNEKPSDKSYLNCNYSAAVSCELS